MKDRKVDQGIGGQEKVGDDGGDDVQLGCNDKERRTVKSHTQTHRKRVSDSRRHTDEDEGKSDPKSQDVASQRLVVLPVAFSKDAQTRVDVVLAQGLWGHVQLPGRFSLSQRLINEGVLA